MKQLYFKYIKFLLGEANVNSMLHWVRLDLGVFNKQFWHILYNDEELMLFKKCLKG